MLFPCRLSVILPGVDEARLIRGAIAKQDEREGRDRRRKSRGKGIKLEVIEIRNRWSKK